MDNLAMNGGRLLTLLEVAELLGVSRRTVSDFIRDRSLPVIRLGHQNIRVDPRRLDEWLEAQSAASSSTPNSA